MRSLLCALLSLAPGLLPAQTALDELVPVRQLIPDVVLDLRYNTTDNFLHQKLYSTDECLLARGVVNRLIVVQDSLRERGLGLKIYDGYRPRAVQYLMWEIFPNPAYVADPASGSAHNRGGAIDCSLVRLDTGAELWMPTPFDWFGVESSHGYTAGLSAEQIANRALLLDMMTRVGGLNMYDGEWWHYTWSSPTMLPLLDFQLR
jgi:D-alanyl-D-alanine dipeptidase